MRIQASAVISIHTPMVMNSQGMSNARVLSVLKLFQENLNSLCSIAFQPNLKKFGDHVFWISFWMQKYIVLNFHLYWPSIWSEAMNVRNRNKINFSSCIRLSSLSYLSLITSDSGASLPMNTDIQLIWCCYFNGLGLWWLHTCDDISNSSSLKYHPKHYLYDRKDCVSWFMYTVHLLIYFDSTYRQCALLYVFPS